LERFYGPFIKGKEMTGKLTSVKSGLLEVSKLHSINYATFGNPQGMPLLCFHGGPGGGFSTRYTAFADMEKYYTILFDQRGCGQSYPLGEIRENTCKNAIDDAKSLLRQLNIKKCVTAGYSYGTTLAMAFAIKNPMMTHSLFLSSVFVPIKFNEWFYGNGAGKILPKEYKELMSVLKTSNAKALHNEFESGSALRQKEMAAALVTWELELFKGLNSITPVTHTEVNDYLLASKRVFFHYTAHDIFGIGPWIIKNIKKLDKIPITIVHGGLDFVSPISTAHKLKKELPQTKLITIPDAGHVGRIITARYYKEINEARL
jgi:proline iminopeptidase